MSSQLRVPPLAGREILGFPDQRAEHTRTSDEAGLHHREEEKERHIETGTMKAIDRPAIRVVAAAAVAIGAMFEAKVKVAAREGIDHHTTEAHPVEK